MYFYNHHEAHALPALFYSPWNDALLVTADGGGDTVHYSQRHFGNGKLSTIYGGEELTLTPPTEDSLGKAYGAVTKALGFRRVRHEGKVTGLAARGQPTQVPRIAGRFSVDERGRIHGDFKSDREIYAFMTKDLALLVGPDQKWLSTTGFLDKVDANLKKAMAIAGEVIEETRPDVVHAAHYRLPNLSPDAPSEALNLGPY